jgi:KaiC/GvpD/RAD55 family RecA-like ATPase
LTEESLIEAVVENFDVDLKEAKEDLSEFIEDLLKEELREVKEGEKPVDVESIEKGIKEKIDRTYLNGHPRKKAAGHAQH